MPRINRVTNTVSFVVLLFFSCSVPHPVDLSDSTENDKRKANELASDTLRVVIMNNSSLFQAVASVFCENNLREIDSFLSLSGRLWKIEKANSFFAPPETSGTYILFTFFDESEPAAIEACLVFFSELFEKKHSIVIKSFRCIYISPGRIFFRPAYSSFTNAGFPVFMHASCRSFERERYMVWPKHRKEWDENIGYMVSTNDYSVASSDSEERMPQYMNFADYPSALEESLLLSLPFTRLKEDRIIIILGTDTRKSLGFR
ncbi:hypothetical protein JW890_00060 [candidate division WOR-3 bacterium]|nr:hypothetical protein [candidate division WOR-3 bacterium]